MVRVAVLGVTAALLSVVLRRQTPELALLLALGAGVWMLTLTANVLAGSLDLLEELAALTGTEEELLRPVVKTAALAVLTRVTAELCRGAGEGGIAAFVETAGTALALGVSLPLIRGVMTMMGELLG